MTYFRFQGIEGFQEGVEGDRAENISFLEWT